MREEERTRRERGEYARRKLKGPHPRKPQHEGGKSSRVACRAFSPPDDSQKRSAIDSHRPRHTRRRDDARARAFLPSRALDRAPFSTSLSAHPHFLLVVFSLHPERDSRAPNTATNEKKKRRANSRPSHAGATTFSRAFVKRPTRKQRASCSRTHVCAGTERGEREKERESQNARTFLTTPGQNNVKTSFFLPKKRKKKLQKKGAFCVQFRVLKKTKGGPFDVKRFDVLPSSESLCVVVY